MLKINQQKQRHDCSFECEFNCASPPARRREISMKDHKPSKQGTKKDKPSIGSTAKELSEEELKKVAGGALAAKKAA